MAIETIDIVQGIRNNIEGAEKFFDQKDFSVGIVSEDSGYITADGLRRLVVENSRGGTLVIELSLQEEAESVIIKAMVKEKSEQEYLFALKPYWVEDKFIIDEPRAALEKAGVINYIRRYAPQLFNELGEVWFAEFGQAVTAEKLAEFWQRFIMYIVLYQRAREWRKNNTKKPVFHTKIIKEPEIEKTFWQANQGAVGSAGFFLLLLIGWYVWLK